MLYCPSLFETLKQKHRTVPKNSKKQIFSGSPAQRLGQYSVLHAWTQKHWDSTAFSAPRRPEVLYCPNFFGTVKQKHRTVPKNSKKQSFQVLQLKDWDSTAFLHDWTQKDWDSAAFSAPGGPEVLYCPSLFETERQKHRTVPIFDLETLKRHWDSTAFLHAWPKNIGTVQCFRHLEGLKCCTVPIFQAQKSKNPVLSQSLNWRPSKYWFFLVFLGQYSVFASLSLKDCDSTASLHAGTQ